MAGNGASAPADSGQAGAVQAVVPSGPVPGGSYTAQVGAGNAILVNKNQNGNPVLNAIRNMNYRFADVIPDYQFNDRTAAIFLSLKFHRLQPLYIHKRVQSLQRAYRTFILCHCDVDDPINPLAEVTKAAIDLHCTLIVAFSPVECGRYLELLKAYENKPVDSLKPQLDPEFSARFASVLSTVRSVNKTDSVRMGVEFRSLADAFRATEADLGNVAGLGPKKVTRLHTAFTKPFLRKQVQRAAEAQAGSRAGGAGAETGEGSVAAAADAGMEDGVEDDAEAREWLATQLVAGDAAGDSDEDFIE